MERTPADADDELFDWTATSTACGGGTRDDAFLVVLLVCFAVDAGDCICTLLQGLAAQRGLRGPPPDGEASATLFRHESHAIKGASSNLLLRDLTAAATACELPFRTLFARHALPAEQSAAAAAFAQPPAPLLTRLIACFRAFLRFMEHGMAAAVQPGVNLEAALDEATLKSMRTECSVAAFEAKLARLDLPREMAEEFHIGEAPPASAAPAPEVQSRARGGGPNAEQASPISLVSAPPQTVLDVPLASARLVSAARPPTLTAGGSATCCVCL